MSNEIIRSATGGENAVSETLEQLAQRANVAHMRAVETAQDAVQHAIAAGQALLEAKKRCRPGTWYVWVTERGSQLQISSPGPQLIWPQGSDEVIDLFLPVRFY